MTDRPIYVDRTMGFGTERVYVFTFPHEERGRGVLGLPTKPITMWVGKLTEEAAASTLATLETWPSPPIVSLMIRCDDAAVLARAIHTYLGRAGNWQTGFVDDIAEFWMEYEKPEHAAIEDLLVHYRRRAGLTPDALATGAGIPTALLHRIEGNPGSFALDIVQNLVNEMGLTLTITQKG